MSLGFKRLTTKKFGYILICPTRTPVVAESNPGCGLAIKNDSFAVFSSVEGESPYILIQKYTTTSFRTSHHSSFVLSHLTRSNRPCI